MANSIASLFFSLEEIYESTSRKAGVSRQQAQLLCAAGWKTPALGELADDLRCDKTNVTGLVDRVEKQGLVKRVPDSEDRRVTRLELTPSGRAKVAEIYEELNRRLAALEEDLPVGPDELMALASSFQKTAE